MNIYIQSIVVIAALMFVGHWLIDPTPWASTSSLDVRDSGNRIQNNEEEGARSTSSSNQFDNNSVPY